MAYSDNVAIKNKITVNFIGSMANISLDKYQKAKEMLKTEKTKGYKDVFFTVRDEK